MDSDASDRTQTDQTYDTSSNEEESYKSFEVVPDNKSGSEQGGAQREAQAGVSLNPFASLLLGASNLVASLVAPAIYKRKSILKIRRQSLSKSQINQSIVLLKNKAVSFVTLVAVRQPPRLTKQG